MTAMKNSFTMTQIEKKTIADLIISQIKEQINSGAIQDGAKLPSERELASMLSVSRSAVREAMCSLSTMGIVDIKSGSGIYLKAQSKAILREFDSISKIRKYSILELVEARKLLETSIVELSALRANKTEKEAIEDAYQSAVANKNDIQKFLDYDYLFHLAIAESARNRFLVEMLNRNRNLLLETAVKVTMKEGQVSTAINSHKKILEAIMSSNPTMAKYEMSYHLETIESAVYDLYEEGILE